MEPFKLGPYQIQSKLGEGGMGAVFRAFDTANDTLRAVKVLPLAMAQRPGFQARFAIEIETLRKLDHPNIIRFFGWGQEEDGTLYYGMELVEGVILEDQLQHARRFHWRDVATMMMQLVRALKHAHDRGVIHRDIKPSNVMLAADGTVKLADFGIAKLYGMTGLTLEGGPIGTANYMSPEQTEGGKVTERSDLYSVGCLMFALLTGRPPFIADSQAQLLKLHRTQEPLPVRQLAPDVPPAFEAVILGLMAKSPEDRIPTTSALLRSLQMVLDSEALTKAPASNTTTPPAAPTPLDESSKPGTVVRAMSELTPTSPTADHKLSDETIARTGTAPRQPSPTDHRADRTGEADTFTPGEHTDVAAAGQQPSASPSAGQDADPTLATVDVRGKRDIPDMGRTEASQSPHEQESGGSGGATARGTGTSHYTTAEDAARHDRELQEAAREQERRERRQATIIRSVVLLVIFAAAFATVVWLTRPPTLHQRIAQLDRLAATDNPDILLDAETDLRDFLRLYDMHPRAAEVRQQLGEIDLLRLERRLDVRARYGRGIQDQSAIERAYLEAIKYLELEPEIGQRRLKAILDLYSSPDVPRTEQHDQLLELTRRRLEQVAAVIQDQAARERGFLRTRLEWAENHATTDPQAVRVICLSLIDLYHEKAWARDYVAQARELLETLADPEDG